MKEQLEWCPICGNHPEVYRDDDGWMVWCGECLVKTFTHDSESIARIMWNLFVTQTKERLEGKR